MNNRINENIELIEDLDPESADSMGYEWRKDVIYDIEAPREAMEDIYELRDRGYYFGKCASLLMEENGMIGVYEKKPAV
jgi:hypothetical protein